MRWRLTGQNNWKGLTGIENEYQEAMDDPAVAADDPAPCSVDNELWFIEWLAREIEFSFNQVNHRVYIVFRTSPVYIC